MSLNAFHPAVAQWFRETLGEPTAAQARGWAAIRTGRHTLIAAPTGSGKTLAAFLTALDALLVEGLAHGLPDEVRVVYVSPLKALGADIHRNLAMPRAGIRDAARARGLSAPKLTAAVRTGDTPSAERAAMLRRPPHILVTTPESLYLLLTAERSRRMLATTRTIIVDEIHAVAGTRRGAHLALSLERLAHVVGRPLQRIGLSATLRPVDEVARFLVGSAATTADGRPDCAIVDEGHRRPIDLAIEVPRSPLEAVLSNEVWEEYYDRLAELVAAHRTTIVFANTRRLVERVARHLSDRLGDASVAAHHGSLSPAARHDAEARLKAGTLKAIVATASLELGVDIGWVDLVCQIGSPRAISTCLQRVGRSGHTRHGTSTGRLFPTSRDELVECTALLRAVRRGDLERLVLPDGPLDVLAQQIVAETAAEPWDEDALFDLCRRAAPYQHVSRAAFDAVVDMLASGFTTRGGRQAALVHRDGVRRRLRARRGARLLALTSGGAIPDTADYRVVLDPDDLFVGTVNEDFAVESLPGDVFQLGNASWRILRIERGTVRVADARGQPPTIPFWLGEAPGRSWTLSQAVSDLRRELDSRLDDEDGAVAWLVDETGLDRAAAVQMVRYLAESRRLLGVLPTHDTLVLERFFDESGGAQLVLHAPFGSRVTRAWGLALRKRFCRQFNVELQAAATDEGVLLSLGPQHAFPLADVFRYLHPATVRDVLVQAVLDAPVFQTRWRWNATVALAVPRRRGGRSVPPPLQRMRADDLLAAAFPDAAACLENIQGEREIPNHPLVHQTLRDCLYEAMDAAALEQILQRLHDGRLRTVARDLPEPSPLAAGLLAARPYAFLDDAPLEERRTQAVYVRRALELSSARDLGTLDAGAIARVRDEAWPDARDADELHDALLTAGFLTDEEVARGGSGWEPLLRALVATGRAARTGEPGPALWVAAERAGELAAVRSGPASAREAATETLLASRLAVLGPATARELGTSVGVTTEAAEAALLALERQGVVLRGAFTPGRGEVEWCDRRLLARIHRYTLDRLRAEIEPVSPADYLRFLFSWQHLTDEARTAGLEGLSRVVDQLEGYEAPAGAWESELLPARVADYEPAMLDRLCLTGRVAWGRLSVGARAGGRAITGPMRTTPIALFPRDHGSAWLAWAAPDGSRGSDLSPAARAVVAVLGRQGASFFGDLVAATALLPTEVERALGELVGLGLAAADGFSGLRALVTPSSRRAPLGAAGRGTRGSKGDDSVATAGRWSLLRPVAQAREAAAPAGGRDAPGLDATAVERQARALIRRYGVVFRRLLAREPALAPWRELAYVYRRLEARGEIRGGRFVAGIAGEQFALPEAVGALRAVRRQAPAGTLVAVSAVDPANLAGTVTAGEAIAALTSNRVLYRDGVPIAAREAGRMRALADWGPLAPSAVEQALVRRRLSEPLRVHLHRTGALGRL
jgi:ATP-dependent Lhr-like helicase